MKLLLCVGEGLGNIIEVLPLAKALTLSNISFDILNLSSCKTETVSWIFGSYAKVVNKLDNSLYNGRIELATTKGILLYSERMNIPCVNNISKQDIYNTSVNEIEVYLRVINELGLQREKDIFDVSFQKIEENKTNSFDFVLHNGCTLYNNSFWSRKKYKNMEELAMRLSHGGYTVACIGDKSEYIEKTTNMTGLHIKDSASIIYNSKFFISNDTGTYHLAAALKKQGIVLFTATSTIKNYHPTFHRTIKIITTKLRCQPCAYTQAWKTCTDYKCRDIPIDLIIKEIRNAEVV